MHMDSHTMLTVGYDPQAKCDPLAFFTTRKYREEKKCASDRIQILIAAPQDITWNTCRLCHADFDDEGQRYTKK
jgi:heterodisulfide reductase subunit B